VRLFSHVVNFKRANRDKNRCWYSLPINYYRHRNRDHQHQHQQPEVTDVVYSRGASAKCGITTRKSSRYERFDVFLRMRDVYPIRHRHVCRLPRADITLRTWNGHAPISTSNMTREEQLIGSTHAYRHIALLWLPSSIQYKYYKIYSRRDVN